MSTTTWDPEAARRDYVSGMVRLGIWYLRHLFARGLLPRRQVTDGLARRVNLYRLTTLWDGIRDVAQGHRDVAWEPLSAALAALVTERCDDGNAEERALAVLAAVLDWTPGPRGAQPFGCWSYLTIGAGLGDAPGLRGRASALGRHLRRLLGRAPVHENAELHFVNVIPPASPFADLPALRADLRALVAACRQAHPQVHTLWCNSWLNDRPEFLALFPHAWADSAVLRSPEFVDRLSFRRARLNTENWWGAFQRRDGSFHHAHAAEFRRRLGSFPHPCRLCHVSISELEQFLSTSGADSVRSVPC